MAALAAYPSRRAPSSALRRKMTLSVTTRKTLIQRSDAKHRVSKEEEKSALRDAASRLLRVKSFFVLRSAAMPRVTKDPAAGAHA